MVALKYQAARKHVTLWLLMLILIGCSDGKKNISESKDQNERQEADHSKQLDNILPKVTEKDVWFPNALSKHAFDDFVALTQSFSDEASVWVEKGKTYRVKVISPQGENAIVIHDQLIVAESEQLTVRLTTSLAYEISYNNIKVDTKNHWLVMDIADKTYTGELQWGYQPCVFISKSIFASAEEMPFFILYHPNNMGPKNFDMAVEYAETAGDIVMATIQEIPEGSTPFSPEPSDK